MRTGQVLTVALMLAAACKVERHSSSRLDTSTATAGANAKASGETPSASSASAPTPGPGAPTAGTPWTVTPDGIGPIRVGMNIALVRRVAGDFTPPTVTEECSYVRPASVPPGVSVMFARGQVVRVDVDSAGARSDAGVAVGDSVTRVNEVYAGRVTETPHKYVQGGRYLSVRPISPRDSTRRIVFETENGRVTRFRSGRVPEVEWVERCG